MASLHKRGKIWWMKVHDKGTVFKASTGETNKFKAQAKLHAMELSVRPTLKRTRMRTDARSIDLPESGYGGVYFLLSGFRVKIGHSKHLRHRIIQLSGVLATIGCDLIGWIPSHDSRQLEAEIHERFWHLRVAHTEWFEDRIDLQCWIADLMGQHDELLQAYHAHSHAVDRAAIEQCRERLNTRNVTEATI